MNVMELVNEIMSAPATQEVRQVTNLKVGQGMHQGDVYILRVRKDHPKGKLLGTRQVAVGNTVGARHIAEGNVNVYEGVKLPDYFDIHPDFEMKDFLGPVIEVIDSFRLNHPEHAAHSAQDGILLQVTYQVDWSTKRRVQD